jgi:3-(3-hydroxy-phenyl)propionate hydroxylase
MSTNLAGPHQCWPVVIAGAGPVGLVTALALAKQSIDVLVLEGEAALPTDLRASTLHCASLDLLDTLGVTPLLLEQGYQVRKWQIRDRSDGVVAEWDLGLLHRDTGFPFRIACEQHKLANIALELLGGMPNATVCFQSRVTGFTQDDNGVCVEVEAPNGTERINTRWLIGADGGRSTVRKRADVAFEGFTWPEQFLGVSTDFDFEPKGYTHSAYVADPVEWAAIFKVPHDGPPGVWRVMFPVDPSVASEEALSDTFIEGRMQGFMPRGESYKIVYRNLYRVHQRVAATFRKGRVLLVGDAAHVNNPVGALGLNSGIHDALNLSEKLGAVYRREAPADLLDKYTRQRRTVSLDYVQAESIRNKKLLEEREPCVR